MQHAAGVAVAVVRGGRVLLGRRIAAYGGGRLQLPGGKPNDGEPLEAAALRELEEETGLRAEQAREVAVQVDDFPEVGKRYTTHFFLVADASGTLQNREPEKCEDWRWYPLDALPDDLFAIDPPTVAAIRAAAP
ncbi:MAG: NUDIX hydrolase [Candidatus Velthaea sp.]